MGRAITHKRSLTSTPTLLSVKQGVYKYQTKYSVVTIDTPKIFKTASQILKNGK